MADCLGFGRPFSKTLWHDGPVVLARVAVANGESRPAEPALHRRGPLAVTADLRLPGHPDDQAANAAVFHAIASGNLPVALDGEFAIAAWGGDRRELTLTRDRLGIRPLFFTRLADGRLLFASFPDALVATGLIEGRFRPRAMARNAAPEVPGGEPSTEDTWIEGIRRILPGHSMTVGMDGEPRQRRYWRYPIDRPERTDDPQAAARDLRRELEAAVSRAMPDQGAPFTHLSGGLDSSAIAALATALTDRPPAEVLAYCNAVPESHRNLGAIDEEGPARAVARELGVTLVPHDADLVREGLLRPLDPVFPDSDFTRSNMRLAHARSHGGDRLLCGFGGDEVVSYNGVGAVVADFLALRWGALRRTSREVSRPVWHILRAELAGTFLPSGLERRLRHALGFKVQTLIHLERALQPAFRPSARFRAPTLGPLRIQRERLEKEILVRRLERQAWQSARHGMRYVFPLLDWRLLEFASTLPPRLQLHGGRRRALLRDAVSDLLPRRILDQPRKLVTAPGMVYQLATDRDALIDEARRVAQSPAATAVFDLAEIERRLRALPDPDAIAETIRANAAQGIQFLDPQYAVFRPFRLARALAQNEADIARRDRSRPRAA